jgi:pilus assembly protein CpaF
VHVRRFADGVRRIESIAEITGMEGPTAQLQDIFVYRRKGQQGRRLLGDFVATGIVPRFFEELRETGVDVPIHLFHPRAQDGHS